MKVKLIKTGEVVEVNDSYGERLIEQGKAVLVEEAPAAAPEPVEAQPEEAKAKSGNTRKGK